MNKTLFCIAMVVLVLAGCRRREDLAKLKAINRSLENANSIIQDGNRLVWEALREKRSQAGTLSGCRLNTPNPMVR